MAAKRVSSDRRRSRPVTKQRPTQKIKRNKFAMALVIIIILMLIFSTFYVVFNSFGDSSVNDNNNFPYSKAVEESDYPVAIIELLDGDFIAVELYSDKMPGTCSNFIDIAQNGYYDNMIVHRVEKDFMMQTGKTYADETTFESPFGRINFENSDITHVDGAISMASTGAGVGGAAEFFICAGPQPFLDGSYAAFGKTIYGLNKVKEVAAEDHDGSFGAVGGGRPLNNIIIKSIKIINL
jgi:peptidyl-prolyl cis-trans isomerase B (cyclophilin B)